MKLGTQVLRQQRFITNEDSWFLKHPLWLQLNHWFLLCYFRWSYKTYKCLLSL